MSDEHNLAVPFTVRCGHLVCAFKSPKVGRLVLCEHYSHRSKQIGHCSLTGERLIVRANLDGIPIAKRGWRCLEGEHLWEKLQSSDFASDTVAP